MARSSVFEDELLLPLPRDEVFAFFADAGNLEAITPPWLRFRLTTPRPIAMREGARIDYRLRVRGIPLRWTSRIAVWDPPHRFVDVQERGPYRLWRHEHRFEQAPEGTRTIDRVEYRVPGGGLVDRWLVRPDVERIFAYRKRRLRELLLDQKERRPARS